jgi:hypothetical protein
MHFFKAFKENLENFKSRYVKRCEPVLGIKKKSYEWRHASNSDSLGVYAETDFNKCVEIITKQFNQFNA